MKQPSLVVIVVHLVVALVTAQDALSGTLQHEFQELLQDVRNLGKEFSMNANQTPEGDPAPLVLLVGGFSTGM